MRDLPAHPAARTAAMLNCRISFTPRGLPTRGYSAVHDAASALQLAGGAAVAQQYDPVPGGVVK